MILIVAVTNLYQVDKYFIGHQTVIENRTLSIEKNGTLFNLTKSF